jgi:DNA-binding MarR family transcriptional regulator
VASDASAPHLREWLALSADQRAAWAGFLRAHREIVKQLDADLQASHGLPLSSFDVLIQLRLHGGGMRMSELADAVVISRSGLTRLVDRLEREGLVERRPNEDDPRSIRACITERGERRLADVLPAHLAGVRSRFLDPLSEEQIRQLGEAWRALCPGATLE